MAITADLETLIPALCGRQSDSVMCDAGAMSASPGVGTSSEVSVEFDSGAASGSGVANDSARGSVRLTVDLAWRLVS